VQLAVAMGLRVAVVDTGIERRELCTRYGAEHFVDFREVEDTAGEVVRLTEGGAHAVFVTGESVPGFGRWELVPMVF
jgi:propanol-preferring alcohol dehydrogenase